MSWGHSPGRRPRSERTDGGRARGPRSLTEVRESRRLEADRRERRDSGYRRALLVGLALSVVGHVGLIALLSSQLHLPRMGVPGRRSPAPDVLEGLRLVRVEEPRPVETPPRPAPVEPPPPREEPEETEEAAPEAGGEPTPAEEPGEREGISNAERLRPREGDSRVWRDFWDEDRSRYLGRSARIDSAIRAILGKYFDSLRVARESYEDARDWTVGDGDERWGVSPEGIHLGDVTIPIPVNQLLSPTGPKRRALERELRELRQIQRQETLREAEATRKERIEEMRERSREEAGSDSTDSGGGG